MVEYKKNNIARQTARHFPGIDPPDQSARRKGVAALFGVVAAVFSLAGAEAQTQSGPTTASVTATSVTEGSDAEITVTLDNPLPAAGTLFWMLTPGADNPVTVSSDFDAASGTVTVIPADGTDITFNITPMDDDRIEDTEAAVITITGADWTSGSASFSSGNSAPFNITDNENNALTVQFTEDSGLFLAKGPSTTVEVPLELVPTDPTKSIILERPVSVWVSTKTGRGEGRGGLNAEEGTHFTPIENMKITFNADLDNAITSARPAPKEIDVTLLAITDPRSFQLAFSEDDPDTPDVNEDDPAVALGARFLVLAAPVPTAKLEVGNDGLIATEDADPPDVAKLILTIGNKPRGTTAVIEFTIAGATATNTPIPLPDRDNPNNPDDHNVGISFGFDFATRVTFNGDGTGGTISTTRDPLTRESDITLNIIFTPLFDRSTDGEELIFTISSITFPEILVGTIAGSAFLPNTDEAGITGNAAAITIRGSPPDTITAFAKELEDDRLPDLIEGNAVLYRVTLNRPALIDTNITYTIEGAGITALPPPLSPPSELLGDFSGFDPPRRDGDGVITGVATIAEGNAFGIIRLEAAADGVFEGSENFTITLTAPEGLTLAEGVEPISDTIIDGDGATRIRSVTATSPVTEGRNLIFVTVTLEKIIDGVATLTPAAAAAGTILPYTISGTVDANDFTGGDDEDILTGTVVVQFGASSAIIFINPAQNDDFTDGGENMVITFLPSTMPNPLAAYHIAANPTPGNNRAEVTILDPPPEKIASIAVANEEVGEEGSIAMTVVLERPTRTDATITYAVGGTPDAADGAESGDYSTLPTATIPAGTDRTTFTVPLKDDNRVENTESGRITITEISWSGETINGITLPDGSIDLAADVNSAIPGVQLQKPLSSFQDGEIKPCFRLTADATAEAVAERCLSPFADFTITDNDSVTISIGVTGHDPPVVISELESTVPIIMTIGPDVQPSDTTFILERDVVVDLQTENGTAEAKARGAGGRIFENDYAGPTAAAEEHVFSGGVHSISRSVDLFNDDIAESDETFTARVTLKDPDPRLPENASAEIEITITDEDGARKIGNVTATSGTEGGGVAVAITLAGAQTKLDGITQQENVLPPGDVQITYTITGTDDANDDDVENADFGVNIDGPVTATVTLADLADTLTFTIPTIDDNRIENPEAGILTITKILHTGRPTMPITEAIATGTVSANIGIADNDGLTVSVANSAVNAGEEDGAVNIALTAAPNPASNTSVILDRPVSVLVSTANRSGGHANFNATGGTGTDPLDDYVSLNNMEVEFADDLTPSTTTFPITIINDGRVESDEVFNVSLVQNLAEPRAVIGSPATTAITIKDDERSVATITRRQHGLEQGPVNGIFDISFSAAPNEEATVSYEISSNNGSVWETNYTLAAGDNVDSPISGELTIATGATGTLNVIPADDPDIYNENITLAITGIAFANSSESTAISAENGNLPDPASLAITDNDTLVISLPAEATVTENTETADVVRLSVSGGAVDATRGDRLPVVTIASMDGTADSSADFTAIMDMNITIPAADYSTPGSVDVPIDVNDDGIVESPETFTLELSGLVSPTGAVVQLGQATATVAITDNDKADFSITPPTPEVMENAGDVEFTISTGTARERDVVVRVFTRDGTATADQDYDAVNETLTFGTGTVSDTVMVRVLDDGVDEMTRESLTINAESPDASQLASATLTIVDNDESAVDIDSTNGDGREPGHTMGVRNGAFIISFMMAPSAEATVAYEVSSSNGSVRGTNYMLAAGDNVGDLDSSPDTFTIAAGTSGTLNVIPVNDTDIYDENIMLTITRVTFADNAHANIEDAVRDSLSIDDADTLTISMADANINVGEDVGTVDVGLSVSGGVVDAGRDSTLPVVTLASMDDTAVSPADFTTIMGMNITIPAADYSTPGTVNAPFTIADDNAVENNEQFTLRLSNPAGPSGARVMLGAQDTTVAITDNDNVDVSVSVPPSVTEAAGATATATITITPDVNPAANTFILERAITVNLSTADGTATADEDYTALPETAAVMFPIAAAAPSHQQETDITILNDEVAEVDETFIITASLDGSNVTAGITIIDDDSATMAGSVTATNPTEEGEDVVASITLNAPLPAGVVNIGYTITGTNDANDDEMEDADFVAATTTSTNSEAITLAAAGNTLTFRLPTNDDNRVENTEAGTLTITRIAHANRQTSITLPMATPFSIDDNDTATVGITPATPPAENEADENTITFAISTTAMQAALLDRDVSVDVAITDGPDPAATIGEDYTAQVNGVDYTGVAIPVALNAGNLSRPVTITVIDDGIDETDTERLTITLTTTDTVEFSTDSARLAITDNDDAMATLTASTNTTTEGDMGDTPTPGVFTLALTKPPDGRAVVSYTLAGEGGKYNAAIAGGAALEPPPDRGTAPEPPPDRTFNIARGTTSVDINITPRPDDDIYDETVEMVITGIDFPDDTHADIAGVLTASLTIDDDEILTVQFSAAAQTVLEADGNGTMLTVSGGEVLVGRLPVVAVTPALGGTAANEDFSGTGPAVEMVEIPAANYTTAQDIAVSINVMEDAIVEDAESFVFNALIIAPRQHEADIAAGAQTSATGVITDNDRAVFSITTMTPEVREDAGNVEFTVSTTAALERNVDVRVFTSDGTAIADQDYTTVDETLTFEQNDRVQIVTVPIINDNIVNANRTFTITLSSSDPVTLPDPFVVTIVNEDMAIIGFSNAPFTTNEDDGTLDVEVMVTGDMLGRTVGVQVQSADGTAVAGADYGAVASSTLMFDSATTSRTVPVVVIDDRVAESEESFTLSLTIISGETSDISLGADASVEITDDDVPGITILPRTVSIEEGGNGTWAVNLDTDPAGPVTVDISRAVGGDSDITVNPTRLEFSGGDPANWETPKSVRVSAREDDDNVNDMAMFSHAVEGYGAITAGGNVDVTASDNEAMQVMAISPATATISEQGETSVEITVTLNGFAPAAGIQVSYDITASDAEFTADDIRNDTATPGSLNGTFTIAPGRNNGSITIRAVDDLRDEDDQDFILTLTTADVTLPGTVDNTVDITITDDDTDASGVLSVMAVPDSIPEDGGETTITVILDGMALNGDITLHYEIATASQTDNITHHDFIDHERLHSHECIIPQGSDRINFTITMAADSDVETPDQGEERFLVTVSAGDSGLTFSEKSSNQITITEMDAAVVADELKTLSLVAMTEEVRLTRRLIRQRIETPFFARSDSSVPVLSLSLPDNPKNMDDMIDGFGFNSVGVDDGGWSYGMWARGQRSNIDGSPAIRGRVISYDGNTTGIGGGMEWSNGIGLIGIAVNYVITDLALSDVAATISRYREKIILTAPYFSVRHGRGVKYWGTMAAGTGEAEVTLGNSTTDRTDVQVGFAAAGADITLINRGDDELVFGLSGLGIRKEVGQLTFADAGIMPKTTVNFFQGRGDLTWFRNIVVGDELLRPHIGIASLHDFGDVIADDRHALDVRAGIAYSSRGFQIGAEVASELLREDRNQWAFTGGIVYDAAPGGMGPRVGLKVAHEAPIGGGVAVDGGADRTERTWEMSLDGEFGLPAPVLHRDGTLTPFARITNRRVAGQNDWREISGGMRFAVGNGFGLDLESLWRDQDDVDFSEHKVGLWGRWSLQEGKNDGVESR